MSLDEHGLEYLSNLLRAAQGARGLLGNIQRRQNGGNQTLSPVVANQPKTVLQLSGEAGADPQLVTVCLYRRFPNQAITPINSNFMLRALIRWGVGKTSQEVLCDYQHGTRITLEASSVDVSAIYLARDSSGAVVGPSVEVYAGVVLGPIASRLNTLTLNTVSLLPATETGSIAIPSYAKRISFFSKTPGAVLNTDFYGDTMKAVQDIRVPLSPNTWIDIPNGMEAFQMSNPGPGNVTATPFVELAL